jgi:hypothetical protein
MAIRLAYLYGVTADANRTTLNKGDKMGTSRDDDKVTNEHVVSSVAHCRLHPSDKHVSQLYSDSIVSAIE